MFRVFHKNGNSEPALRRCGSNIPKNGNISKHPANGVMRLQQSLGNQIVQRLVKSGNIMTKLVIGRRNDPAEQEADQVADRVMQMPEQGIQRQTEPEEEEVLQPQSISSGISSIAQKQEGEEAEEVQMQTEPEEEEQIQAQEAEEEEEQIQTKEMRGSRLRKTSDFADRLKSLKGGGKPLPDPVQTSFENRFGHDFSDVRTHTGCEASNLARSINAKAFTSGKDIVFGSGQYSPHKDQGKRLIAHELTHTIQQQKRPFVQRATLKNELEKELKDWAKKEGKTVDPKHKYYAFDLQEYAFKLISTDRGTKPIPKPKLLKARKKWRRKFKKAELLVEMILASGPKVQQKEAHAGMILRKMAQAGFSAEAVKLTGKLTDPGEIESIYNEIILRARKASPAILTTITKYFIKSKGKADNPIISKLTDASGSFEKKLKPVQLTAILNPLIKAYENDPIIIDILAEVLIHKKGYRKVFSKWMWKTGKGDFLFKILESEYFIDPDYEPTVFPEVGKLKLGKDMPWVYANKQKYYVKYLVQLAKETGVEIKQPKNMKFKILRKWLDTYTEKFGEALAKKYPDDPKRWIKVYEQIADIFFYHVLGRDIKPHRGGKLMKLGPAAPKKLRLKADCDVLATYAMRFFVGIKDTSKIDFKTFEPIGYMALDPKGYTGHAVALMRRDSRYYIISNKEVTTTAIKEETTDKEKEMAIVAMRNEALLVYDEKPESYKVYYADAEPNGAMKKALANTKPSTRRKDLEP
jgi:hypothetical protein